MKLTTLIAPLCLLLSSLSEAAPTTTATVSYDETYDNRAGSLTTVACSDGQNGLITRYGWQNFGNIPRFPNIGGAAAVAGWNSPSCGTCWALTYNGTTINVLAIDHTLSGFNIALAAMNTLTHGNAVQLGRINANAVQVPISSCGL